MKLGRIIGRGSHTVEEAVENTSLLWEEVKTLPSFARVYGPYTFQSHTN